MNNRQIQRQNQADHTKLTAVTIGHGGRKVTAFVELWHNERGEAVLPMGTLDRLLDQARVRRGDTYTVA